VPRAPHGEDAALSVTPEGGDTTSTSGFCFWLSALLLHDRG
jgi:hypothetical protein